MAHFCRSGYLQGEVDSFAVFCKCYSLKEKGGRGLVDCRWLALRLERVLSCDLRWLRAYRFDWQFLPGLSYGMLFQGAQT